MQRQIIIGVLLVAIALVGVLLYSRYRTEAPAAEQSGQSTPLPTQPGYGTIKIPPQ